MVTVYPDFQDQVYRPSLGGGTYVGVDNGHQAVDVYIPTGKPPAGGRPCYLNCQASGFVYSELVHSLSDLGYRWNFYDAGFTVIDMTATIHEITPVPPVPVGGGHYWPPEAPELDYEGNGDDMPYQDAGWAMSHVRMNAAKYGINPDRILIGGLSNGADVAMWAGLGPDMRKPDSSIEQLRYSTRPDAVLDWSGQTWFPAFIDTVAGGSAANYFNRLATDTSLPAIDKILAIPDHVIRASALYFMRNGDAIKKMNATQPVYIVSANTPGDGFVGSPTYDLGSDLLPTYIGGPVNGVTDAGKHDAWFGVILRLVLNALSSWHLTHSRLVAESGWTAGGISPDWYPSGSGEQWWDDAVSWALEQMPEPKSLFQVQRRFMRLREEPVFAQTSVLDSATVAYNGLSSRMSSRGGDEENLGVGRRVRNVELNVPLAFDGRFQAKADANPSADPIPVSLNFKRLLDVLFRRKFTPGGSMSSLGDLRSYNLERYGPQTQDKALLRGLKSESFTLRSRALRSLGFSPIDLQVQLTADNVIDGDGVVGDPADADELFRRKGYSLYSIQASTVRVTPAADALMTDPGIEVVEGVRSIGLTCRRAIAERNPSSGVSGGAAAPLEPVMGSEAWTIAFEFETFNDAQHAIAQGLVTASHSEIVEHPRYNVRIDFGATNRTLFVALDDPANQVLAPAVWGVSDYVPGAMDPSGAMVFAVYATDLEPGKGFQYVPAGGDMVRWQGNAGHPGYVSTTYADGYALRVGAALLVSDDQDSDVIPGITIADSLTLLGGMPSTFPTPQALVTMWFSEGFHHVPVGSSYEHLVPGGFTLQFDNVALNRSEGLDNDRPSRKVTFVADRRSTLTVLY